MSTISLELDNFQYLHQGKSIKQKLSNLHGHIAHLNGVERKNIFEAMLDLNNPNYLDNLTQQNKEQIDTILQAFVNYVPLSDKQVYLLFKTLEHHQIDNERIFSWLFNRKINTHIFSFELQLTKPFYHHLMDEAQKALSNLEGLSPQQLNSPEGKKIKYKFELITAFFTYHELDEGALYDQRRPIENFLKKSPPHYQTQAAKLIINYYKINSKELLINNPRGFGFSKYIKDEFLANEILKLQKSKIVKNKFSTELFKKVVSVFQALFNFKETITKSETELTNKQQLDDDISVEAVEPIAVGKPPQVPTNTKFADTFFQLKLMRQNLADLGEIFMVGEKEVLNSVLPSLDDLLENYFLLYNKFQKKNKDTNFSDPELAFFIQQKFPKFLNGSLESYTEAIQILTGDDKLSAHRMFQTNIQLIKKHLDNQLATLTEHTDTQALQKIEVEQKYLTASMR